MGVHIKNSPCDRVESTCLLLHLHMLASARYCDKWFISTSSCSSKKDNAAKYSNDPFSRDVTGTITVSGLLLTFISFLPKLGCLYCIRTENDTEFVSIIPNYYLKELIEE